MKQEDIDKHSRMAKEAMENLGEMNKGDYSVWLDEINKLNQVDYEKVDVRKVAREMAMNRVRLLQGRAGRYSFGQEIVALQTNLNHFNKMANEIFSHYSTYLLSLKNEFKNERESSEEVHPIELSFREEQDLAEFEKTLELEYYNQTEVADVFKKNVRTIQNWIKERKLIIEVLQPGQRNISREAIIERKESMLRGFK